MVRISNPVRVIALKHENMQACDGMLVVKPTLDKSQHQDANEDPHVWLSSSVMLREEIL